MACIGTHIVSIALALTTWVPRPVAAVMREHAHEGNACLPRGDFDDRIAALLTRFPNSTATTELVVGVRLETGPSSQKVDGQLLVTKDGAPWFSRSVTGGSCQEVQDALTFALELHLEAEDAKPAPQSTVTLDEAPPLERAPAAPVAVTAADFEDNTVIPEFGAPAATTPEPTLRLRAGMTLNVGVLPNPTLGAALVGDLRLVRRLFLTLELGYDGASALGEDYDIWSGHLRLGLLERFALGKAWELTVDSGGYVSFSQTWTGEDRQSQLAGGGIGAQLGLEMLGISPWIPSVQLGWAVPLARPRYVEPNGAVLWEQAAASFSGGIFFGRVFP